MRTPKQAVLLAADTESHYIHSALANISASSSAAGRVAAHDDARQTGKRWLVTWSIPQTELHSLLLQLQTGCVVFKHCGHVGLGSN